MIHVKLEPLTFRLSTWPWGGSYSRYFNHNSHNIHISPILDYLAEQLDSIPQSKVRKTTFTLVNVFSKFTRMSYGRTLPPPDNVLRGPVSFTFALTRRDDTPMIANHIIWGTGMSALWGSNLQYSNDYLTISLPISLCARTRLNNTLLFQMETLYRLVGGWSKSQVMGRRSFTQRTTIQNQLRNEFYHRSIPRTMWMYPWSDWKYCREFWADAQDMLKVDVDDTFFEYYLRNLTQFHDKTNLPHIIEASRQLEEKAKAGIMAIEQQRLTPEAEVLEHVLPTELIADLQAGKPYILEGLARAVCRGQV